jgi:hypothetical protein
VISPRLLKQISETIGEADSLIVGLKTNPSPVKGASDMASISYDTASGLMTTVRISPSGVGLDLVRLIERATGAEISRYKGKWTAHLVDPITGDSFIHHEPIDRGASGDSRSLLLAVLALLRHIRATKATKEVLS